MSFRTRRLVHLYAVGVGSCHSRDLEKCYAALPFPWVSCAPELRAVVRVMAFIALIGNWCSKGRVKGAAVCVR